MSSIDTQDNSERETFLLGDTREELLTAVKRHVDFKNLAEKNQRALVADVEHTARQMIRRVANVVHGHGHMSTPIRWGEFKIKAGNVEPKAVVPVAGGVVDGFLDHSAGVLIFVDPDVFMAQRADSEVFPDQPDLMDQAQPEKSIEEQNAERLRQGIKPLPIDEGEPVDWDAPRPAHLDEEVEPGVVSEEDPGLPDAPPTQPEDGDLVDQDEEKGAAEPAPSVEDYRLPDTEEVETPPVTLDKPVGRRGKRPPRPRDVPTGA